MIDIDDLLHFFIPGLDAVFFIIVVILILAAGFHKFFDERKKRKEIKEKSLSSNNCSSNSTPSESSIFEYKGGKIIAEAFHIDYFLSEDSKYISFTTPVSKPKVFKTELNHCKNDNGKFIVRANVQPSYPFNLLGFQSPEGILHTTYQGRPIDIECFLKDITIEKLRQQKNDFVVCKSIDVFVKYTLKYKWDVINSQYL